MTDAYDEDEWADYDSSQLFPGCDCGHDATEHGGSWDDDRWLDGCALCPCDVMWEHS